MAKLSSVKTLWDTLTEVDLKPLREDALRGVNIALVGKDGSGRSKLAGWMRCDPNHPNMITHTPVMILNPTEAKQASNADLVIVMVNPDRGDMTQEQQVVKELADTGCRVLVFINQVQGDEDSTDLSIWSDWDRQQIVFGDVDEANTLGKSFIPVVMGMLSKDHVPLARAFPLFRVPVAKRMTNDTCLSNAAYSFSTGLAEIVPGLGIPLTVADIIVLTKMQAFLVYKLGLALGYSIHWQDYVAEFGGVLGGGFLWRQIARSLVGLIPLYGIVPKVAIAYAGTYVVGQVVLSWYLTGRHLSKSEMKALFSESLRRGRDAARRLLTQRKKSKQEAPQLMPPDSED